ncbi:CHAT domain-containing protein [Streptomyces sp. NPDC002405]
MAELSPEMRAEVRKAMAAPEFGLPFMAEPAESVLGLRMHRTTADMVFDARGRLTLDQPGGADGVDLEAVYLAACYYTARLKHLPREASSWEELAFELLFAIVLALRPEAVPEPYREMFAERPPRLVPAHEILNVVGNALYEASAPAGERDSLALAVGLFGEASEMARGQISEPHITFNLGSALLVLSQLDDPALDPAELRRAALHHMRRALALLPVDDPARERMLATAMDAQARGPAPAEPEEGVRAELNRYMRDGGRDRLDPVIDRLRSAAAAAEGSERAHRLVELGQVLRMRFEMDGELDHLDESIDVITTALDAPLDAETRATASSFLGLAHLDRFTAVGDPADLEAATTAVRAACAAETAASPAHAQRLTNLAAVLTARFDVHEDIAALDEAVEHLRHAVVVTPPSQHDHPVMLIKLAVALRRRGMHVGEDEDVAAAEGILRQVAEDPSTRPNAHLARLELGDLLAVRGLRQETGADLAEAAAQCRAITLEATEDIRTRLLAVTRWAMLCALLGDLDQACTAYGVALDDVLPKLTGRALGRASQEARLREADHLANDAAAVEITADRPQQALIRLEQGRGVLLAQALQLRGRHDDLVRTAPALAHRFEQVCAALVESQRGPEQRKASAAEFDGVVEEIRAQKGFEDFHRPPEWRQLSDAAAHGPVAVINVSVVRCDVLLLRRRLGRTVVEVLPLSKVTREEIGRRAEAFRTAVAKLTAPDTSGGERYRYDREMKRTLRWLGKHIVGPVLERLGYDRPVGPGEAWPRMWWCPTGALSLLPLHAAVLDAPDGRRSPAVYTRDRVVSSYVPTLGALLHARARTAPTADRTSLVAVAVDALQAGDAYPRLMALEDELAATRELPGPRSELRNGDATPDAVLAALRTHSHAHLACHGVRDGADPSRSRLLLHSGDLTIGRLAAERLLEAEFAYLAACHSAAFGEELVDEAVSVASAFQLSGYRQVIGSLWTVEDDMGPLLAREVYRLLAAPDTPGAAHCLHRAVGALRAHPRYGEPLFWASVIHTGP